MKTTKDKNNTAAKLIVIAMVILLILAFLLPISAKQANQTAFAETVQA